jgi:hypothetical protein
MQIEIVMRYHLKQTIEIIHERISLIDNIKSRHDKAYNKINPENYKIYKKILNFVLFIFLKSPLYNRLHEL